MSFYRDSDGNVYGFLPSDVDVIEMTDSEVDAHINPKPTPEQLAQQAKSAIYALLDQTAQQYDYRNFAEVSQFVLSGVWKAEAESLIAWQDAVWLKAYEMLKEPIESVDDFVAQLPKF